MSCGERYGQQTAHTVADHRQLAAGVVENAASAIGMMKAMVSCRDQTASAATLINEGCKITGMITGSGPFLINGEIDGDCDLGGTVTLAKNGLWKGTIKAADIIIAGRVEGDIVVEQADP